MSNTVDNLYTNPNFDKSGIYRHSGIHREVAEALKDKKHANILLIGLGRLYELIALQGIIETTHTKANLQVADLRPLNDFQKYLNNNDPLTLGLNFLGQPMQPKSYLADGFERSSEGIYTLKAEIKERVEKTINQGIYGADISDPLTLKELINWVDQFGAVDYLSANNILQYVDEQKWPETITRLCSWVAEGGILALQTDDKDKMISSLIEQMGLPFTMRSKGMYIRNPKSPHSTSLSS